MSEIGVLWSVILCQEGCDERVLVTGIVGKVIAQNTAAVYRKRYAPPQYKVLTRKMGQ